MVASMIWERIEPTDKCIILRRRAFYFEAIIRAVVGRADQLVPVSLWRFAARSIRGEVFQMGAPVLIAQKRDKLGVCIERNIFRVFDGVQVGNERDRDPVISRDTSVATYHYTVLSRAAAAQDNGSLGAHPRQVHGGVPRAGKGSIVTVRLFEEDCNIGPRSGCEPSEREPSEQEQK